ncbi:MULTISPECIES: LysR substrate-binding domain-containing protein [Pseudoalteromonas]|uniref:HTH lysR-type domain-containing protein n=1 Tax=Pseudoalteromonas aurantia 208 TaxID=1314867 RepID=A0ABR9ED65_9GAMM|nr:MULTISPECIES: LysR substrate-binding domain-containing protein [Pseudoalteromonas]MBE0368923.1 hypothetical protein [Pseudoalteromonas aurantia 208]MBQ4848128.1 LysR family transcriptional regulator [Pseudoalteromonas sp. MMG005]MBQ4851429.1 LysR family transcriptional regulator [Pseudoalteromonas sp. MMG012]
MFSELTHLTALRCVEAAARHHSYSKAALELNVTQAAISQQIRLLEQNFGCKLFFRKGKSMQPTAQGEKLAMALNNGFGTITHGIRSIQSEPIPGCITVTTTQSFASMLLMPNLWKFSVDHPNIIVRVIVSTDVEDIKHGHVDIAIRYGQSTYPELEQTTLFSDETVVLCSPKLAQEFDFSSIENIKKCWLVNYTKNDYWANWFATAGLTHTDNHNQWLEVSNMDIALSAVMAGHGACLGSARQAKHFIDQGLLVAPFDIRAKPEIRYTCLHDPSSPRIQRILIFKNWLVSLIQNT